MTESWSDADVIADHVLAIDHEQVCEINASPEA